MAIKLSDAQVKVLVELNTNGVLPKGARGASLEKLEGFGFIESDEALDQWMITGEGQKEIGVPVTDREATAKVAEFAPEGLSDVEDVKREALVVGVALTDVEAQRIVSEDFQADVYRASWANWEKELGGFEATIGWKNTEVWDGLTATEIRDDMDTAKHVSRKDRRKSARVINKLAKRGIVMRHG